jgi:hypothetical protein
MMQQPPPSIYYWSLSAASTELSGTKFRLEVRVPVVKTKDFISEFNATVFFLYLHLPLFSLLYATPLSFHHPRIVQQ